MNKKIICFVLVAFFAFQLSAKPISESTAEQVAKNFLSYKDKSDEYLISETSIIKNSNKKLFYFMELHPAGFIAISTDSDIFPIIAYSFRNMLITEDENLIYFMLKEDAALRLDYYKENKIDAAENHKIWKSFINNQFPERDFQQWPSAGSTPTDGWVETQWHQSGVYNSFCPLDNGGERSVVGCVATAMAMIVDFHQYIGSVYFTDSDDYYYGSNGIHIDDDYEERDFPSFPELNNYLNVLGTHYNEGLDLTNDDKAALSFACGVSIEMWYSSNGSGAYTAYVAWALQNKFDYDSAEWVDNEGSYFYTQLSNEMINMRPAEMSIYTPGWNNGHAIICDGYNTDDYYHLNYGWGTSNNTCWYFLPEGMPYNYSLIGGAVMNIEGGPAPIYVQGDINVSDVSPVGTYITLEGEKFYECYVTNSNGNFDFPAVLEGQYTATAILDRIYYDSQDVYIDEDNDFLQFNLGNFDAVTGYVSAPINPDGCHISIYQNGERMHSAVANYSGYFSIADVLPGDYVATASLGGNYFQEKEITITLENQTVDFNLSEYDGNLALSYAGYVDDAFHLIHDYYLTCAVLLTNDELENLQNDIFAKVKFISPINSDEGEIYIQIWKANALLSEKQITDFSAGEWLEIAFDDYFPIDETAEYYIGYKISSTTADLVYHDAGPRVQGKGAFLRTTSWIELNPDIFDFNFCIEPIIISQNFGLVTGNVQIDGDISDVVIKAQNFISHPNLNGNYELYLKEGNYEIIASAPENDDVSQSIEIVAGETINLDFNFEENPVQYGDVDGENGVQAYDAALTLQYAADMIEFEEWQIIAADVDGNGEIQALDAALILQYSAGIIDEFPVESGRTTNCLDAKVNIEKK